MRSREHLRALIEVELNALVSGGQKRVRRVFGALQSVGVKICIGRVQIRCFNH